jgi:hypothetical protein
MLGGALGVASPFQLTPRLRLGGIFLWWFSVHHRIRQLYELMLQIQLLANFRALL